MNDDSDNCVNKISNLCPNCGQMTNSSFSRLVKDACGHMKCRMCLLYEEQGCESCRKERSCSNNFNYTNSSNQFASSSSSNVNPSAASNVVLPLKSVINKNTEHYSSTIENIPQVFQKERRAEEYISLHDDEKNGKTLTELKNVQTGDDYIERLPRNLTDDNQDASKMIYEGSSLDEKSDNKSKKYNNKSHILVIPGDPDEYQCLVCQKKFQNKKCIHYHNFCATGIKPFQCTICEKSFVNRSHFEYHERTHTGYKPFKCNLCDKAFPQKNKLNRHMISHSSEKNFACSKCDKKYSKKADLQSHMYVHSNATNNVYSCKSCGKSFGNVTHLKRHSRAHSNDRPHICEHCNKSFKDKSLLVRHYKTHGKERPFTCAYCSRGFLSKSELRRHLTIHSEEKPFSCTYCQTVFRRKDNLNRHIRHHHSDEDHTNTAQQAQMKSPERSNLNTPLEKMKQKCTKSKTKGKKTVSKSQSKVPKITYTKLQKQINSRLDSMGNITPVIRTTGEVSNAVPVINGPTRRFTESNYVPKKTLTYMEPIPPEEAVVINKRIEAKLYPQSNISQNYFFHDFSDSNDNLYLNSSSLLRSSLSFSNRTSKPNSFVCDTFNYNDTSHENTSTTVPDRNKQLSYTDKSDNIMCYEEKLHNNYVSTIKKHTA